MEEGKVQSEERALRHLFPLSPSLYVRANHLSFSTLFIIPLASKWSNEMRSAWNFRSPLVSTFFLPFPSRFNLCWACNSVAWTRSRLWEEKSVNKDNCLFQYPLQYKFMRTGFISAPRVAISVYIRQDSNKLCVHISTFPHSGPASR